MRIGHTLFGGAVTGLVIASGAASCAANASTYVERSTYTSSEAIVTCTLSSAPVLTKLNSGVASVSCIAEGEARGTYTAKPKKATTTAKCKGKEVAYLNSYGNVGAYATTTAAPYRFIKLYPIKGLATASSSAVGYVWQVVHGEGLATAVGFGSTYHVGYGLTTSTANIAATPTIYRGYYGSSLSTATITNYSLHNKGASSSAYGICSITGDAKVRSNGINYFNGNGIAVCTITLQQVHVLIYQSQTGNAIATGEGACVHRVGLKGVGLCVAKGVDYSEIIATAACAYEGQTSSSATGRAKYYLNCLSNATATATGTGSGYVWNTNGEPKPAKAYATATGDNAFSYSASSTGLAIGYAKNITQHKEIRVKSKDTKATAKAISTLVKYSVVPAKVDAYANAIGDPKRMRLAESSAIAEATAQGYNQINDLVRAPEWRTAYIEPVIRIVYVLHEDRTVKV